MFMSWWLNIVVDDGEGWSWVLIVMRCSKIMNIDGYGSI